MPDVIVLPCARVFFCLPASSAAFAVLENARPRVVARVPGAHAVSVFLWAFVLLSDGRVAAPRGGCRCPAARCLPDRRPFGLPVGRFFAADLLAFGRFRYSLACIIGWAALLVNETGDISNDRFLLELRLLMAAKAKQRMCADARSLFAVRSGSFAPACRSANNILSIYAICAVLHVIPVPLLISALRCLAPPDRQQTSRLRRAALPPCSRQSAFGVLPPCTAFDRRQTSRPRRAALPPCTRQGASGVLPPCTARPTANLSPSACCPSALHPPRRVQRSIALRRP